MLIKEKFMKRKFIKLTEIKELSGGYAGSPNKYELGEIYVNSKDTTLVKDASFLKKKIKQHRAWPAGLDERIYITELGLKTGLSVFVIAAAHDVVKEMERSNE